MDGSNFTDEQLEEIESGGMAPFIHPHYPFVLIDTILREDTPPLVTLWIRRSDLRSQLVARWCEMAKTYYWARKECDALREYLIWTNQEIHEPLRRLTKLPRPTGRRGQPEKTAEYFLLADIARLLIADGYSDSQANAAVGLVIAKDPSDASAVEAAIKKVQRARQRFRTDMPNVETESPDNT